MMLEHASDELHRGAVKTAFDKAFHALESCYVGQANVRNQKGKPDDKLYPAIEELLRTNRITRDDYNLANHLRLARNIITHPPGFEPTADEVVRCIDRVRSLCARFGGCVHDVMIREVICVTPDEPIAEYVRMMRDKGFSQFPVLDADKRVIGTLDEKAVFDAVDRGNGGFRLDMPVSAVMRAEPLPAITAETSLVHARKRMRDEDASAFLILSDRRVVGLITKFDVMF